MYTNMNLMAASFITAGRPFNHPVFQCILEQTIINEVLEPITFVVEYPTVLAKRSLQL
jgi:hypothetical protein